MVFFSFMHSAVIIPLKLKIKLAHTIMFTMLRSVCKCLIKNLTQNKTIKTKPNIDTQEPVIFHFFFFIEKLALF